MHLVAGTINQHSLRQLLDQNTPKCTNIMAAIAYCDDRAMELLTVPRSRNIPLTLYCRYDLTVPVHPNVFKWFTEQKSLSYVCKVVPDELHAKVIWWKGVGAYVGSANLSYRAWNSNIEAGIFVTEEEMQTSGMYDELEQFFEHTERHSKALTPDFLSHYRMLHASYTAAAAGVEKHKQSAKPFYTLFREGATGNEAKRALFHSDWGNTLVQLHSIASKIANDEFRPSWVPEHASAGAQADQFLNSVFYHQLRNSDEEVNAAHQRNNLAPDAALHRAMLEWKQGDYDHTDMLRVLKDWAPELQDKLSRPRLIELSEDEFVGTLSKLHATRDYFRRYAGEFLTDNKDLDGRIDSGLRDLWARRSEGGLTPLQTLDYVIWGSGPVENRIWNALHDKHYRIKGMGMSTLSEIVGWAQPDKYPPRNDRSKKALKGLGYRMNLEVEL